MKPTLGISDEHLNEVAYSLNRLLADEVVLYMQTKNYHWNIEGANFGEMHQFYERLSQQLDEMIDEIAERIRMIGYYAEARLADYLKLTSLLEDRHTNVQVDQLKKLLACHETIIHNLRRLIPAFIQDHHDVVSSDFVTQLLRKHESMAWALRSYLR